jgi:hypothetical protein
LCFLILVGFFWGGGGFWGGIMTQTLYAHMNKIKNLKNLNKGLEHLYIPVSQHGSSADTEGGLYTCILRHDIQI